MFERLPILLVDCQTTGTRPEDAHVVELAWCVTTAEAIRRDFASLPIEATLVRLPEGAPFPRAAREVSGLGEEALRDAPSPEEVWERFAAATQRTPVAVAHYARFEEGFLRRWANVRAVPFPCEPSILCTHRFAKRLLGGLPSASLRAVAGFLGRDLPELRRAGENVAATAWIWSRLVERFLEEESSARSVPYVDVAELRAWIEAKPKKPKAGSRIYVTPRETRLALPDAPGVYRFLSRGGRVLYVGKATSLRDRVNSYFRTRQNSRKKIAELMAQVHDVCVTEVETDVEAALLETDEIKALLPPYNVALRGQKVLPSFCSRDFSAATTTPDRHHPLGPFASIEIFDEIHAVVRALETGEGAFFLFWGIVEEPLLQEGLSLFRARHSLTSTVDPLALLALGAAKLARDARAEQEESVGDGEDEERVWDAAEVADSLERRLASFVRNVRRARWRCRLTDATLTWDVPGRGRRCLMLQGARLVDARWLGEGEAEPVPESWRRPLPERQGIVVGENFDRMRVALTELRRIAARGEASLRLGPGDRHVLRGERLVRALESCR